MDLDKRAAKRSFNFMALTIIIYNILFLVTVNMADLGLAQYLYIKNPGMDLREIYDIVYNTGLSLILASTISVLAVYLCYRQPPSFKRNKTAGFKTIFIFFILMQGMQFFGNCILQPFEVLLSQLGYGMEEAASLAGDPSIYISGFVYSIIFAPLSEELLFRGIIMKKLAPNGKVFAIIISAFLFALIHQNIVQFPITFLIGMLFGYLAMEYSLGAAIVLHILNNLFVEVIGFLGEQWDAVWNADSVLMILCAVASISLLALKGKEINEFWNGNKTRKNAVKYFFTSVLMVIVILYFIISTIASVNPVT